MAKKNIQDTGQNKTNTFVKGLNKDADPTFIGEGMWSHARNAVNNTLEGNIGTLSNEVSNVFCAEAGATLTGKKYIIGTIHLYTDKWIITNPPYLARNKCDIKTVFDKYDTNDLYKCFITSLTQKNACKGGIFIIPVGFFLSPRDIDVRCRNNFLSMYRLTKVKYFEEDVFPDTSTTVVAFSFEKSQILLTEQTVEWILMPSGKTQNFTLSAANDWIIGGDIYNLPITNPNQNIKIRRYVEGQTIKPDEQLTCLTLTALDSGKEAGRICLEYKEGYKYNAKESSRAYATLCIQGIKLSVEQQIDISTRLIHLT